MFICDNVKVLWFPLGSVCLKLLMCSALTTTDWTLDDCCNHYDGICAHATFSVCVRAGFSVCVRTGFLG